MAHAEIIAIGSELLGHSRLDTNSLFITEQLNQLGVDVVEKHVIGDDRERLAAAIRAALERVQFVLLSGGLGPTEDDVTRDAAAAALGRPLSLSTEQEQILIRRFQQINRPMAENNRRQAFLIDGAEALTNPNGSAPGQFIALDNRALILLPGPPLELKAMVTAHVLPRLRALLPPRTIKSRSFRIAGMGESDLDALIAPVYASYLNPTTTVLSAPGDLSVTLIARCATEEEADSLLQEVGDPIAALLGDRVYSTNNEPLEVVVGNLLRAREATISTAESCTGGLVAARLSEYAGSSDFYVGSFIIYNDQEKQSLLGISHDLLSTHTAVSEPVARAMAEHARLRTGATYTISVTGYAGPGGGTDTNPAGTVFIGIAGPEDTRVVRYSHGAGRSRIRALATQNALDLLRRRLLTDG